MLKMTIELDTNRIEKNSKYILEQISNTINEIFIEKGLIHTIQGNTHTYYFDNKNNKNSGKFCILYTTLKKQTWFIDNIKLWKVLNSDNVDDINDFSEEDLLARVRNENNV